MKQLILNPNDRAGILEYIRALEIVARYDTPEKKQQLLVIPDAKCPRPKDDASKSYVYGIRNFYPDGTMEIFHVLETFTKEKPASVKSERKPDWDALVEVARRHGATDDEINACYTVTEKHIPAEPGGELKSVKLERLADNNSFYTHYLKLMDRR